MRAEAIRTDSDRPIRILRLLEPRFHHVPAEATLKAQQAAQAESSFENLRR